MITSSNGNHQNDQSLINHFVNQAVAQVLQFDFVGVLQVPAQSGRWHMWRLEAF